MPGKFKLSEKLKKYQPHLKAIAWLGFNTIAANYLADQYPNLESYRQILLLVSGLFHILGRAADIITTDRYTKKAEEIEGKLDIDVPIYETNPFHPKRAKFKDMLRPEIIALELTEAISISIFPPFGMLRGVQSFHAAYINNRYRNSLIEATAR